jgi:hypothetical protein
MNGVTILLTSVLLLGLTGLSQAEELRIAEGYLTDGGKPLANQTLLLEGQKEVRWFDFTAKAIKLKVNALTDDKGFLQFIDLPPGDYTLKLVRAGEEPISLTKFTLDPGYRKSDISAKLDVKTRPELKEKSSPLGDYRIKKNVLPHEKMKPVQ